MKNYFILLILILILGTVCAVSPSGMVAYYNLDETTGTTAIDSYGFDENGLASAGVTIDQTGKIGKSYLFGGSTTQYLTIPSGLFDVYVYISSNKFDIYDGGWKNGIGRTMDTYQNTWTMFTIVEKSDGTGIIYQNGKNLGTWSGGANTNNKTFNVWVYDTATDGMLVDLDTPIHLFSRSSINTPLSGYTDEISLWNKDLSETDINSLYGSGTNPLTYCSDTNTFAETCSAPPSTVPVTTSDANALWNTQGTVTFTCAPGTGQTCKDLNYSLNSGTWIDTNYPTTPDTNKTNSSIDQSQLNSNPTLTAFWVGNLSGIDANQAFKFTPTVSNISKLTLKKVSKVGSPTANIIVSIQTDIGDGSSPSGTILASHTYTNAEMSALSNADFNIDLDTNLTIGNIHWVVVGELTPQTNGNYFTFGRNDAGIGLLYANAGAGWVAGTKNAYFATWKANNTVNSLTINVSDGNNLIRFKSSDTNGNDENVNLAYHAVDRVNPSTSYSGCSSSEWNLTNQTITISGTDATSGIKNIFLWDSNGTYVTKTTSPITYVIGSDGNHALTYHSIDNALNTDSNQLSYCALDLAPPVVGQTLFTGFNTSTTYIKGDGNIFATATDAGSGIASCKYSTDNGVNWLTADYNTTHCYKNNLSVVNGQIYQFDLNAFDNLGKNAKGTATIAYTGDTSYPVTTITQTNYSDTNIKQIHLACVDAGSGCATTWYRIDGGAWVNYTTDFNYANTGYHYIDFNSTDNLTNTETTQRTDLNMPVLLTIFYPKDIQTLVNISKNWNLRVTGGLSLNLTNLTTDQNHYVSANTLTTFYISDVNGHYTENTYTREYYTDSNTGKDTLQPYLFSIASSLITTINVQTYTTNTPIPNITIKFFSNLPGLGNTLIGQGITDSKGQILQLFIGGQKYVFEVYQNGALIRTYNFTANTSEYWIKLNTLTFDTNSLTPIVVTPSNDFNSVSNDFYSMRNTLFSSCSAQTPCFPSALIAIIITIIVMLSATALDQNHFIGVKGLSVIAFCCFTVFFGIGWLPVFIYAFLGSISLLMAVIVQ